MSFKEDWNSFIGSFFVDPEAEAKKAAESYVQEITPVLQEQELLNQFSIDTAKQLWEKQAEADRIAMQFSSDEARKLRDWQADQSNTAYQRAVSDMRSAGINPILAAANGGASTPAGSAGSGISSARQAPQLNLENYVNSFKSLVRSLESSERNTDTMASAQKYAATVNAAANVFGSIMNNSSSARAVVSGFAR